MKKTKIICTLGPSTDKPGVLDALIDSGMDVAAGGNFPPAAQEWFRGYAPRPEDAAVTSAETALAERR